MMIGIVSRLTDQKGFDLIAYVMDDLCQDEMCIRDRHQTVSDKGDQ